MTMITGDITTAPLQDKKIAQDKRKPSEILFLEPTVQRVHTPVGLHVTCTRDTTAQPLARSSEDVLHETSLLNAILLRTNTNESSTKFRNFFYLTIM